VGYSDAPQPTSRYALVPNLTSDGRRVFFETDEPLVVSDTDRVRDVYEWEEAGQGSCSLQGGCIYLISSGHSARDNYLYGVSATGDDVFIMTSDLLVGADGDATPSIYDARVGGGFAEPSAIGCEGEGCRPTLTPAPGLTAPASGASGPSGNVGFRCPAAKRKVKRKGKFVCVAKAKSGKRRNRGHGKHQRHAGHGKAKSGKRGNRGHGKHQRHAGHGRGAVR
jgi:hypothetical protein